MRQCAILSQYIRAFNFFVYNTQSRWLIYLKQVHRHIIKFKEILYESL
jgi:hypothetical protein